MLVRGTRWQPGASKRVDTYLVELFSGRDKSCLKVGIIQTEDSCHCGYRTEEYFIFFFQSTVQVCGSVKITT